MLKRFLPIEHSFFLNFQQSADILVNSLTQFNSLVHNLDNTQLYVDTIATNEKEGDKIARKTFKLLHQTFITPFDRHDIHRLTSCLDDILDLINRCAQRFPFYELKAVPPQIIELAEIAMHSGLFLNKAIYRLENLKKSDEIFELCEEIDDCESKAQKIVLDGEKELFIKENDFKEFFKLKEIYSRINSVINLCQDSGNLVKGIILEYS